MPDDERAVGWKAVGADGNTDAWKSMKESDNRRKRFRQFCEEHARVAREWAARGHAYPPPDFPKFPDDLRGMACGAKTRAGAPCKLTAIYLNGRCKFHGGMSTGPRTPEGKAASRLNGSKGGRPRKAVTNRNGPKPNPTQVDSFHDGYQRKIESADANPMVTQAIEDCGGVMKTPNPLRAAGSQSITHENVQMLDATTSGSKPNPMDTWEKLTFCRCADCANLSAGFTCLPAQRGELGPGAPIRPSLGTTRKCVAYLAATDL
jgi:hypothetical protein